MVTSVATSPHALTVVEVDYENVEQVRRAHREAWRASEGFSLTYLPFIVVAVADALANWPRLNASVEEGGLRLWREPQRREVAVDLDYDGLIVPIYARCTRSASPGRPHDERARLHVPGSDA